MAAIYSNGGNRWNILGFNFTKRDVLSSVYKISMVLCARCGNIISACANSSYLRKFQGKKRKAKRGASDPTMYHVSPMKKSQSLEDLDRIEVQQTVTTLGYRVKPGAHATTLVGRFVI